MSGDALIVEVALNGPRPLTVQELIRSSVTCVEAGASIVHFHIEPTSTRSPLAGAIANVDAARRLYKELPDILWYPPLLSVPFKSVDQRVTEVRLLAELGLVELMPMEPGSVTLGGPALGRTSNRGSGVVYNSPSDIEWLLSFCDIHRLGPQLSIFEPGFLRFALEYHRARPLPTGTMAKLLFGGADSAFGLPPNDRSLAVYLDLLAGTALPWMVSTFGGDVMQDVGPLAIARGGHVRVGLESNPASPLTNVALVTQVVAEASRYGRPVADCKQAREILGLVGSQEPIAI
jgi:3-keto-5-aminohexanoate cleavage enzyme